MKFLGVISVMSSVSLTLIKRESGFLKPCVEEYLPKSRASSSPQWLGKRGDFYIIISRGNDKSTDAYLFSDMIVFRL